MLKHFCELKFKNEQNLKTSLEMVRQCLCSDKELPVRVEAAVALQVLLVEQEKGKQHRDPALRSLVCKIKWSCIQILFYTLSQDTFAAHFLKLFYFMNSFGFKQCLFNSIKKFQDFPFETFPIACQVPIHR